MRDRGRAKNVRRYMRAKKSGKAGYTFGLLITRTDNPGNTQFIAVTVDY